MEKNPKADVHSRGQEEQRKCSPCMLTSKSLLPSSPLPCFSLLGYQCRVHYMWNKQNSIFPNEGLQSQRWQWNNMENVQRKVNELHNLVVLDREQWVKDGGFHSWWWKNLFSSGSPMSKKKWDTKPAKVEKSPKKPKFNNLVDRTVDLKQWRCLCQEREFSRFWILSKITNWMLSGWISLFQIFCLRNSHLSLHKNR